jgi:hypothetical protein
MKTEINRSIILPVFYGCKAWSLTLRGEHRLRVFENRVLRKIFRPKRDEVAGEYRRLHSEELYALYSSPDIIWVIKSRATGWAGHMMHKGSGEMHTGFWWGDPREGDNLKDTGIDGKIILKWIFKKWDGEACTGLIWFSMRTGSRLL